jgi:hypothetical protein
MPKKQKPRRNKKSSSSSSKISKRCTVLQIHPLSFRYITNESFAVIEKDVTNFLLEPLKTVLNIQRKLIDFEGTATENQKDYIFFLRSSLVYINIMMGYFAQQVDIFMTLENIADNLVEEYTENLESMLESEMEFVKSEIATLKIFHASRDCVTPTSLKDFLLSNVENGTLIDLIESSLNAPKIKQSKETKQYIKEAEEKYFEHIELQRISKDDFDMLAGETIDV